MTSKITVGETFQTSSPRRLVKTIVKNQKVGILKLKIFCLKFYLYKKQSIIFTFLVLMETNPSIRFLMLLLVGDATLKQKNNSTAVENLETPYWTKLN